MRIILLLFLFSSLVFAGSYPQKYAELGLTVFNEPFKLAIVETEGAIEDATFITLSKTKPSRQSKDYAKIFKKLSRKPARFVFAGENSAKTAAVLKGALKLLKNKKQPHLEILFLGKEKHSSTLKELTESLDATYHFLEYGT